MCATHTHTNTTPPTHTQISNKILGGAVRNLDSGLQNGLWTGFWIQYSGALLKGHPDTSLIRTLDQAPALYKYVLFPPEI